MQEQNHDKIFQEERIREFMNILKREDRLPIADAFRAFSTTPVTIRKGPDLPEERRVLGKRRGRGLIHKGDFHEKARKTKEDLSSGGMRRIAGETVEIVRDGDAAILDSCFITTFPAKEVKGKKCITKSASALKIALGPLGVRRKTDTKRWMCRKGICLRLSDRWQYEMVKVRTGE